MYQQIIRTFVISIAILAQVELPVLAQSDGVLKSRQTRNNGSSVLKSQSRFLRANNIRIHYLEWNRAGNNTVILLHGLYDNADTWSTIATLLSQNYRVIAPDRRGTGLTDKPDDGYAFQTLAQDVLSLIDKLRLRRVAVVGHSAGAGVALTVAVVKPEAIDSAILVDGGFWAKRTELTETEPDPPCNKKPVDCRRIFAIERGSKDYDAELLYERVSAPTLLIIGIPPKPEAEQFASELREAQNHAERVANKKLRKGTMVIINETGHWIQRDQPAKLAAIIESFLKKNSF